MDAGAVASWNREWPAGREARAVAVALATGHGKARVVTPVPLPGSSRVRAGVRLAEPQEPPRMGWPSDPDGVLAIPVETIRRDREIWRG